MSPEALRVPGPVGKAVPNQTNFGLASGHHTSDHRPQAARGRAAPSERAPLRGDLPCSLQGTCLSLRSPAALPQRPLFKGPTIEPCRAACRRQALGAGASGQHPWTCRSPAGATNTCPLRTKRWRGGTDSSSCRGRAASRPGPGTKELGLEGPEGQALENVTSAQTWGGQRRCEKFRWPEQLRRSERPKL